MQGGRYDDLTRGLVCRASDRVTTGTGSSTPPSERFAQGPVRAWPLWALARWLPLASIELSGQAHHLLFLLRRATLPAAPLGRHKSPLHRCVAFPATICTSVRRASRAAAHERGHPQRPAAGWQRAPCPGSSATPRDAAACSRSRARLRQRGRPPPRPRQRRPGQDPARQPGAAASLSAAGAAAGGPRRGGHGCPAHRQPDTGVLRGEFSVVGPALRHCAQCTTTTTTPSGPQVQRQPDSCALA